MNLITKENIDKIISIDEAGFNTIINEKQKGLSPKGTKINIPIKDKRIKNNSLLCALTTTSIIHHDIYDRHIDGTVFCEFIKNTIDKLEHIKNIDYKLFIEIIL